MNNILFDFYTEIPSFNTQNTFMVRLQKEYSEEHIHNQLYYTLWFPGYYGFNWDALWDCLCDFSWIREEHIVLVYEEIPDIPADLLKIYLDILSDAIKRWANGSMDINCVHHTLKIYFPEKNRAVITSISNCEQEKVE